MAARTAAQRGAKVLLLERDSTVGQPVRCAEAVMFDSVKQFSDIEERCVARVVKGMIFYAPDGTQVNVWVGGQMGLILERALFDRRLAEQAAEAGADILTRANVNGLVMNDGRVEGVEYVRFSRQRRVKAPVVIAADGVESRVGRWAGIETRIPPQDLSSTYQMVLSGIDYDNEKVSFYFSNETVPGGYIWVFPKGEHTANVGLGVDVTKCGGVTPYDLLNQFVRRRFGRGKIVSESAGGVPLSRPLAKPVGNGIILVGDAARHCNPLGGGGIHPAMVSGLNAGEVAAEAVEKGDASERFLRRFVHRIENSILKPHRRNYRIARAVAKLSDELMNATAREVAKLPPEKCSLRNIFLQAFIRNPRIIVDIMKSLT